MYERKLALINELINYEGYTMDEVYMMLVEAVNEGEMSINLGRWLAGYLGYEIDADIDRYE